MRSDIAGNERTGMNNYIGKSSETEVTPDLSKYEKKHIQLKDIYGNTFTGLASYGNYEFLMHEYGGDEDGIFIEDYLVYNSQIASIEEIEVHGTAELCTERLIMRRYTPEDAEPLYQRQSPVLLQDG